MKAPSVVPAPAPDRVSTLELFFDLVFVFTITQVTHVIVGHPGGPALAQASLELAVICWMYGGYAWMTNSAGPDTWQRRVLLLVGMAGFFMCALAIPHAFGDDGVLFGLGYLVVTLVHQAGFLLRPGRTSLQAIYRLAPWNLSSAGLVLAAGWAYGNADWALWGGALALQIATPFLARTSGDDGFALNAEHFAERHGLMILIILGESLVSVGHAAEHGHVDVALVLGVLAGLVCAAAMWWAYFVDEDTRAAHAFEASGRRQRGNQALTGYGLAHLLMIFGVIAVAAGTQLSVAALTHPAGAWAAWLVAAGAGLYLIGGAGFRAALGCASPWPRLLGALACLAAVPAGTSASAAVELAVVGGLIALTLVGERRVDAGAASA